jgi:hypothetical protein
LIPVQVKPCFGAAGVMSSRPSGDIAPSLYGPAMLIELTCLPAGNVHTFAVPEPKPTSNLLSGVTSKRWKRRRGSSTKSADSPEGRCHRRSQRLFLLSRDREVPGLRAC